MKALVIDDERPALDELSYLLERDPRINQVLTTDSATEGLRLLQDNDFDVVFLDIQMPGLTGLDMAGLLHKFHTPPAVVFVTAHEEHAVEAFDLQAVDYVLKPIRPERLAEATRRAIESTQVNRVHTSANPAAGRDGAELAPTQIPVELAGVTRFVDLGDITHVQAQGDYVRLHTGAASHLMRTSLAALEEEWRDAGFLRIHRSMLVSLAHVTQVRTDSGRCTVIVGQTELGVSRRHTRALRDLLLRRATR